MGEIDLAEGFEGHRGHLRGVAYRMLGSLSEADDAVQEGWLRASRAGAAGVANLGGWLTTIVARVCLDMLRARTARREDLIGARPPDALLAGSDDGPGHEAALADAIGLALLVVLETLEPAERVAFVLHDSFGVHFEQIASLLDRTPAAARQLASRARRRVQGAAPGDADLSAQRRVVEAFLAASRDGNYDALVAVLHPDVVLRADQAAVPPGVPLETRGSRAVADRARGNRQRSRFSQLALVDGAVGVVVAPAGRLWMALRLGIDAGRIRSIDVVADPARLAGLAIGLLPD